MSDTIASQRPNIPQSMQSRSVLLKNMFDADEYVLESLFISITTENRPGKLRKTGTKIWLRTSRVNAKKNTAKHSPSKLKEILRLRLFNVILSLLILFFREKYMSSLILSSLPKRLSKL